LTWLNLIISSEITFIFCLKNFIAVSPLLCCVHVVHHYCTYCTTVVYADYNFVTAHLVLRQFGQKYKILYKCPSKKIILPNAFKKVFSKSDVKPDRQNFGTVGFNLKRKTFFFSILDN